MKFKLMKNEHGAVITHVALALSGIEREDVAQLIVSPQMALILKDKMSVKEIMTAISSMVMTASELAHRLVEMCEPQCEDCDYDCISELLNSAVDSVCMQDNRNYSCRLVLDLTTSFYRIVKCVSNNHKHICCRKMHLTIDPNVRSNCNVELLCLFHSISKNTINQLIACINCVCNPTKSELNLF